MREVKAVIRPNKLDQVLNTLHRIGGLPSIVVADCSVIDARPGFYERVTMTKIELMVPDEIVETVVGAIADAARTGMEGDGRVFVIPIEESVVIRTGDRGESAR